VRVLARHEIAMVPSSLLQRTTGPLPDQADGGSPCPLASQFLFVHIEPALSFFLINRRGIYKGFGGGLNEQQTLEGW